jgi:uncharacterized damage-inducible protein DinB
MTDHITAPEILADGFDRVHEVARAAVDGLTDDELTARLDKDANTVAWLVWHLARVQDDHIAEVAELEQVWTAGGWHQRFGLRFDPRAIGYGQSSADVAQVRPSSDLLLGYLDAVTDQTKRFVEQLTEDDLARVVDARWDPPVTLAVRLVSVISDDLQHAGQAAFVRGVLLRRR